MRKEVIHYAWSVPERALRSLSALAGGLLREVGEVVLPARVRRSHLYTSMVDFTLRYLIENLGQVEGVFDPGDQLPANVLVRRAAGNVIEAAGIMTFYASPVWVLAALADLSGAGRELIGEIAEALKQEKLLDPDAKFETVDQLLDGLERTAGRLAQTVNTPPLDVAGLRREWSDLRREASRIPRAALPSLAALRGQWTALGREAAAQERSVFEISSAMAISAVRGLPENARWLSRAAGITARRTGQVLAQGLMDHYRNTLSEITEAGFVRYWLREFRPYLAGALRQFSPRRSTTTQRLVARKENTRG